jgi:signal transduction histidine kinase
LSNALKFGAEEEPHVGVTWAPEEGGAVRFVVSDDGPGIAPAHRERIFHAFERLSAGAGPRGSGLGLAICERIVQRSGGDIGVDSEPGAGSRFWFTLPAAD